MASRLDTLIAVFWEGLNDPAVFRKRGRRALAERSPLPRITFVNMGGPIVPPDMVGEGKLVNLEGQESRDRIVRVRSTQLLMVIHGQDEEQAEQLLHNCIATWERIADGAIDFGEEQWPEQDEGQDSVERRGSVVLLPMTVQIPVYKTPKPLIRVSGWSEDGSFIDANGAVYGDNKYGAGYQYKAGEVVC